MSMRMVTGRHADIFASQPQGMREFDETCSFLSPVDLSKIEAVCVGWRKYIQSTHQWGRRLDIPSKTDLDRDLPKKLSYGKFMELNSSIFGERFWRRYIGEVGPVPPIPETISLGKYDKLDPCDSSTTIGKEYVWIYSPSRIRTELEGFSLNKPDDPDNPEAPRLIEEEGRRILDVPVTINNIKVLFKHPKAGHPSKFFSKWKNIVEQYGDKRIEAGWICVRKKGAWKALSYYQQQALAQEKGVVIDSLGHRIVFNFLVHTHSNVYPERSDCSMRTSTFIRDPDSTLGYGSDFLFPVHCCTSASKGLLVNCITFSDYTTEVSVALPAKIPATFPLLIDPRALVSATPPACASTTTSSTSTLWKWMWRCLQKSMPIGP